MSFNLIEIAGLIQWTDQATTKFGKERTENLLEISSAGGRLPENLKDLLIRMTRLSSHESTNGESIAASDYLAVLTQLDNLLTGSEQYNNNILPSILSPMNHNQPPLDIANPLAR